MARRTHPGIILAITLVVTSAIFAQGAPPSAHLPASPRLSSHDIQDQNLDLSRRAAPPTAAVIQNISVGTGPYYIAVDPTQDRLYVVNSISNNISVIDGTTDRVVDSIGVGGPPSDLMYDPNDGRIYVSVGNYFSPPSNITIINTTADAVIGSIPTSTGPDYLAFDSDNGMLYAVNFNSGIVSVIDPTSGTIVATIQPVGQGPTEIAFDPANGYLYIANSDSGNVTVINGATNTVVAYVPPLFNQILSQSLAVDAQTGFVYVPGGLEGRGASALVAINGTSDEISGSIPSPSALDIRAIAYDGANGYLYVPSDQNLTAFNAAGGVFAGVLPIPSSGFWYLAFDPANGYLYASNYSANDVEVINGTSYFQPAITSFTASPASLDVGQPLNLSASAVGGKGPLRYSFRGLPPGCSSLDGPRDPCAPTLAGDYRVTVFVNDSLGNSASAIVQVEVYPGLLATLSASDATVVLGQDAKFVTNTSGGLGPYSYAFAGLPPGCESENASAVTCLPTQAGVYNVTVTVTDQNYRSVTSAVRVQVVEGSSSASAPASLLPGLVIGVIIGVAVTVIGGAVALIARSRAKRRVSNGGAKPSPDDESVPENLHR